MAKAESEAKKVSLGLKKPTLKEAKASKVKTEKKEVNSKAPKAKNSNTSSEKETQKTRSAPVSKPSTAKGSMFDNWKRFFRDLGFELRNFFPENKEPAKSRKPATPPAPPNASSSARGVKRQRVSRDDVNAAKRVKIDEVRLTLRKPLLDKIAEKVRPWIIQI